MDEVRVNNIRNFAFHGCMPVEELVGTWFETNVIVSVDLSKPTGSDQIDDTVNYVTVTEIVSDQMAIRSNLIEHVGGRILDGLQQAFPQAKAFEVEIKKLNAPVKGEVGSVGVVLRRTKS